MAGQAAKERSEAGKQKRKAVPRSAHAEWTSGPNRTDPVDLLTSQDEHRLPWLVPVRHARMAESAFAFYRGSAAIMAADLAKTPDIGVNAQLCGDAHLGNFGTFASAERRQVFDVNDFDETLPGPWEWDVKRLAASMVIAARDNEFPDDVGRSTAQQTVQAYRDAMAEFAARSVLDVWYAQVSLDQVRKGLPSKADRKDLDRGRAKARSRNSLKALEKLAETNDEGQLQIRSQPPLLVPLRELHAHIDPDERRARTTTYFDAYKETLARDRRHLLRRFSVTDVALKVVGVGSVGTRCWIVLLTGQDHGEPLFLQVKEAGASVLERYLPPSKYRNHGERVVEGRRLVQASSDIFLGWAPSPDAGRDYYWRQFHDMKGSADVAAMSPQRLGYYGQVCAVALAHAHARSGDAATIEGYLGGGRTFAKALAEFAVAYADQNDDDYAAFQQAIADGRIEASEE
jgi:uncharacterized protein (DUF2252 family)